MSSTVHKKDFLYCWNSIHLIFMSCFNVIQRNLLSTKNSHVNDFFIQCLQTLSPKKLKKKKNLASLYSMHFDSSNWGKTKVKKNFTQLRFIHTAELLKYATAVHYFGLTSHNMHFGCNFTFEERFMLWVSSTSMGVPESSLLKLDVLSLL